MAGGGGRTNSPHLPRTWCSQDAEIWVLKLGKSWEDWVQLVTPNTGSMVNKSCDPQRLQQAKTTRQRGKYTCRQTPVGTLELLSCPCSYCCVLNIKEPYATAQEAWESHFLVFLLPQIHNSPAHSLGLLLVTYVGHNP